MERNLLCNNNMQWTIKVNHVKIQSIKNNTCSYCQNLKEELIQMHRQNEMICLKCLEIVFKNSFTVDKMIKEYKKQKKILKEKIQNIKIELNALKPLKKTNLKANETMPNLVNFYNGISNEKMSTACWCVSTKAANIWMTYNETCKVCNKRTVLLGHGSPGICFECIQQIFNEMKSIDHFRIHSLQMQKKRYCKKQKECIQEQKEIDVQIQQIDEELKAIEKK